MDLGLSVNPKDQWIHALKAFDEGYMGNFELAEHHVKLAKKYEKELNVWTTVNWGDIYLWQGRLEEAQEKFSELLDFHDLNDSNQRAHLRGIKKYIELLQKTNPEKLSAVYKYAFTEYPDRARCYRADYAAALLSSGGSFEQAEKAISGLNSAQCKNVNAVKGVLKAVTWYEKSGKSQELHRTLIEHGDIAALVSSVAALANEEKIIKKMRDNGISLMTENTQGLAAVHLAALSGKKAPVAALMAAGVDVDSVSSAGWSALMIAVYSNNMELAKFLLENGADATTANPNGMSAIAIASQNNNVEMQRLLESYST